MLGTGLLLKPRNIARREFHRTKKANLVRARNFLCFGRNRPIESDGIEVNEDAGRVIPLCQPQPFWFRLGNRRRAEDRCKSKREDGQLPQGGFEIRTRTHPSILGRFRVL